MARPNGSDAAATAATTVSVAAAFAATTGASNHSSLARPWGGQSNGSLASSADAVEPLSVFRLLVLSLLALLTAGTFVWNLLVLATILRVKALRRAPHNLVASTAAADAMVAALVMPLSLAQELSAGRRWPLGRPLCHAWVCCDVLCCTASIWSVAAVALDRYWSIARHLDYTLRARRRASSLMIGLTWALSAVIAFSPLLGWGRSAYSAEQQRCQVSQEPSYAVFSTCGAFYLPLGVVLFVYWKIYRAAKFRVGGRGSRRRNAVAPFPEVAQAAFRQHGGNVASKQGPMMPPAYLTSCDQLLRLAQLELPEISQVPTSFLVLISVCFLACSSLSWPDQEGCLPDVRVKEAPHQPEMAFTTRHASVTFQTDGETWREQKEKKAAIMVGILIGVFVLCWIPFFVTELISPLCSCTVAPVWKSIFLWLGYSNSFFNPLIYTAFNKNYNNALKNLFVRQR